jgi:hypothetical protein
MTEMHLDLREKDIDGLGNLGLSRVLVEVSSTGTVLREIGFDSSEKVIYRFPGKGRFGECGLFDIATFALPLLSDLSLEEFNAFFDEKG